MGKKKPSLAELEVTLRDEFQKYRRRLDMVTRIKGLGLSDEETGEFISHLHNDNEEAAKKIMKIAVVRNGG